MLTAAALDHGSGRHHIGDAVKEETTMRRRDFVAGIVVAGAALASWPAWASRWLGGTTASPAETLLAAFRHPESAAAIGRAYLAGHPQDADPDTLVENVTAGLRCRGCDPEAAGRADLRQAIAREVRDDFAQGRVVNVDGWVLSATEARLCGLAALVHA